MDVDGHVDRMCVVTVAPADGIRWPLEVHLLGEAHHPTGRRDGAAHLAHTPRTAKWWGSTMNP